MGQVLIDRIQVTVTPKDYLQYAMLDITVKANGKECHYREQLTESDIESRFDLLFERAKREMLAELKKQTAAAGVTP